MNLSHDDRKQVVTLSVDVFISILVIGAFLYYSYSLVSPFVPILIWAVIIAVALQPVHAWIARRVGGRGRAAALIAALGLALVLGPTGMIIDALAESLAALAEGISDGTLKISPPPPGVAEWPLIGGRLDGAWRAANENLGAFSRAHSEAIQDLSRRALGAGAGLVIGMLQFALSVVIAGIFLANAEGLTGFVERIAARISARGRHMIGQAQRTIRNVSRGVLGVAVIQGGLGAIGIVVAGLPFAGFLAAALVISTVVQAPILVIVPLVIYVWSAEPTLFALLFTAYMIPVMLIDNVLKPVLMARGLSTPMSVILLGVIGGTVSAGILGLFVGPVVLALFYEMLEDWVAFERDPASGDAPSAEGAGDDGAA